MLRTVLGIPSESATPQAKTCNVKLTRDSRLERPRRPARPDESRLQDACRSCRDIYTEYRIFLSTIYMYIYTDIQTTELQQTCHYEHTRQPMMIIWSYDVASSTMSCNELCHYDHTRSSLCGLPRCRSHTSKFPMAVMRVTPACQWRLKCCRYPDTCARWYVTFCLVWMNMDCSTQTYM